MTNQSACKGNSNMSKVGTCTSVRDCDLIHGKRYEEDTV